MAKTAAALHILVKEEKLALDLLEQLKNGATSASWRRSTPFARQANAAVT
ncbi:PpiC-type peptidyl-prolyl cis-trans isomerase [Enterobacter cloacae]|uniref:PpiC-type peptidyl-prolyl cis-trans isomerase n=1 Tax=Enterobacter cloacae TaxID=550 RepID=A0A377LPW4_ENTCL|nr:PpiC-type peptidyl-prolyl cis-trans isomerase [Enterobacter cloacae]